MSFEERHCPRLIDDAYPIYQRYLQGKSICLVGGDDRIDFSRIHSYDVVVRINNHWLRQKGRCDVLYHTVRGTLDVNELLGHPYLRPHYLFLNLVDTEYEYEVISAPRYLGLGGWLQSSHGVRVGFFAQGEWAGETPYGASYDWLNLLHRKYDAKFFTGIVALADLIRFEPREIFVTGMSFFSSEIKPGQYSRHSHVLRGNYLFLRDALKNYCSVKYDAPLLEGMAYYASAISAV